MLNGATGRVVICCLVSFSYFFCANAQQASVTELYTRYTSARNDSAKYISALKLYFYYEESNRDSALYFANRCVLLSNSNGQKLNAAMAMSHNAYQLLNLGRYGESLQFLLDAYTIAEDPANERSFWLYDSVVAPSRKRIHALSYTHSIHGVLMSRIQNPEQEIFHFTTAKKLALQINNAVRLTIANMNLGRTYLSLKRYDTALLYEKDAEKIAFQSGFTRFLGLVYCLQGNIYLNMHDTVSARNIFFQAMVWANKESHLSSLALACYELAKVHLKENNADSSFFYIKKGISVLRALRASSAVGFNISNGYEVLGKVFQLMGQKDSVIKYQMLSLHTGDSSYQSRINQLSSFHNLTLRETLRLQNIEKEKKIYQERVRNYALLSGVIILSLVAFVLFRSNRQRKRINKNLEDTLQHLHTTQSQLVQSEKMASLGELTAGIAHEIQNPLNFVNNFSDLNKELLQEMREELSKGNLADASQIAADVISNEEKINHHGKRADGIVKGMLQHSRSSSNTKEETDINALVDEYLRLAYHGLRAKDKSFNATMITDFDDSVGMISMIPQDIGRVILNLITNAFYVVDQKKKRLGEGFEPTVTVSTKKRQGKVEISVKDNGDGIPQNILDKIFQPFFTTKPTGEGTGLGLSLSYDIVKAHGGELQVETKEGEGSIFQIIM